MYGTRIAAEGWQDESPTTLVDLDFARGGSCPGLFRRKERGIVTSVHRDDFAPSGPANSLDCLEGSIASRYDATIEPRHGPGPNDAKEGRVLNRVVRWCPDRVDYEADPRQVERLVAACGSEGAKPVATLGARPASKQLDEDVELPTNLTAFRGSAARGIYLAADRIEIQFAREEVCRWMSKVHSASLGGHEASMPIPQPRLQAGLSFPSARHRGHRCAH